MCVTKKDQHSLLVVILVSMCTKLLVNVVNFEWGEMQEGAHNGEGCDIQQCRVANPGDTKLKLSIRWMVIMCC
jgi:hypothetical protein